MARPKYDGIIEAVHFKDEGIVDWVRAYLRRGPTWSDLTLLNREELIDQLKSGKRFVTGKRSEYMGTTFETADTVNLIEKNNHNILIAGEKQSETDCLDGVPIL
jgi:hypothetical protein